MLKETNKRSRAPLNDLVNMTLEQFNTLNKDELRKINSRMLGVARSRIRRFDDNGLLSVAESFFERNKKKLTGKKLKETTLQSERSRYKLLKQLMLHERTIDEQRQYTQKVKNGLLKQGIDPGDVNLKKVIIAFEQLKERNPEVGVLGMKYNALQDVVKYAQKHTRSKRLSVKKLEEKVMKNLYQTDTSNWSESQLSLIKKAENENELESEFEDFTGREL